MDRRVVSSHVGSLDADDGAGEPLQLSSGQILHVPLPQVTQICPATAQTKNNQSQSDAESLDRKQTFSFSGCVRVYRAVCRRCSVCRCRPSCPGWLLLTPAGGFTELHLQAPPDHVTTSPPSAPLTLTVFGIWSTYCGLTMARRSSSRILVK